MRSSTYRSIHGAPQSPADINLTKRDAANSNVEFLLGSAEWDRQAAKISPRKEGAFKFAAEASCSSSIFTALLCKRVTEGGYNVDLVPQAWALRCRRRRGQWRAFDFWFDIAKSRFSVMYLIFMTSHRNGREANLFRWKNFVSSTHNHKNLCSSTHNHIKNIEGQVSNAMHDYCLRQAGKSVFGWARSSGRGIHFVVSFVVAKCRMPFPMRLLLPDVFPIPNAAPNNSPSDKRPFPMCSPHHAQQG